MTSAQKSALLWLRNRNGEGVFLRNGTLLAGGDIAPVMRATWNKLKDDGHVVLNDKRLRMSDHARTLDLSRIQESSDGGASEEFWHAR